MIAIHPAERMPFEYFVVRCVPRVDRGEMINVGVVLYCQTADFLDARTDASATRLRAIDPSVDVDAVSEALATLRAVCRGERSGGEAAVGGQGKRFGWLAAPRSTALQPGPVHGGLTADPPRELERLFETLVRLS